MHVPYVVPYESETRVLRVDYCPLVKMHALFNAPREEGDNTPVFGGMHYQRQRQTVVKGLCEVTGERLSKPCWTIDADDILSVVSMSSLYESLSHCPGMQRLQPDILVFEAYDPVPLASTSEEIRARYHLDVPPDVKQVCSTVAVRPRGEIKRYRYEDLIRLYFMDVYMRQCEIRAQLYVALFLKDPALTEFVFTTGYLSKFIQIGLFAVSFFRDEKGVMIKYQYYHYDQMSLEDIAQRIFLKTKEIPKP